MNQPRILIMAGGTGGHVFPALAVARHLQAKGWDVHWLGTKEGLESGIIPKAAIPIHYISVKGLRRNGLLGWVFAPIRLVLALYQSCRVLISLKPKVVLGMGGFITGPGGVATWLMRYPLVIHEANSVVGMTNRWLAKIATRVLEGFPGTFQAKTANIEVVCTGNPIRAELLQLPLPKDRFKDRYNQQNQQVQPLRLLVLGGSRGALALNQICPAACALLPPHKRPEVWHQTGSALLDVTTEAYKKADVISRVDSFIEDMAKAYTWADLVLCRAGALTISELTAVGVGSILVPYPFAVDDHQTQNGHFLEKAGGALMIQQKLLTPQKLADIFLTLSEDRKRLVIMAESARGLAKPDALKNVSAYCEKAGGV